MDVTSTSDFRTPLTSLFLNKTIKSWYAFSQLECKEHFGINIILICRNLSTERRRHDVHVLFGDVIYDARNAHWRVKNKINRKFTLFTEYHKNFHLV